MKRTITLLLLIALWAGVSWAASNTITTNGSDCSVSTRCLVVNMKQDLGGATLTLSGTWTGTIQFEATGDGGMTWVAVSVLPLNSTTSVTSSTGNGTWQVNTSGFTGLRMRSSASMTGSAIATITPSAASARSNGALGVGLGTINSGTAGQVAYYATTAAATSSSAAITISGGVATLANGAVATTQSAADNSTKVATTAYVDGVTANGQAGNAICWKTATTLSYCTSIVAVDGTCTCH